jgi:colicin import membrane protein
MKTITVLKAFVLTLADHTMKRFEKGLHEVEAEIAGHWYVKAHSTAAADVKATENAAEKDAEALKAKAEAEKAKAEAEVEEAKKKVEAEAAALKAKTEAEAIEAAAKAAGEATPKKK